ncbi:MAG TPA: hypothetical protein VGS05_03985 [Candidatus Sulfotelmatobacter sp.]|nr:hypothetical protein [Candidatus Sulfotelmatobacter sp.]
MNSKFRFALMAAALLIVGASSARIAYAAPEGPGCSMLAPAQVQKVIGQPFGDPSVVSAFPAFANQPPGSNCTYSSQSGRHVTVNLIIYVDASPSDAKQTFDKLRMWYPAKSSPSGIGDSAYIDSGGAIHVLKGKVRYYIHVDPKNEKQEEDLALSVAQHLEHQ